MYIDLLVKEYRDMIDSKQKTFQVAAIVFTISFLTFLFFVTGLNNDIPFLKDCTLLANHTLEVKIGSGVLAAICFMYITKRSKIKAIVLFAWHKILEVKARLRGECLRGARQGEQATETPKTDVDTREEKLKKFFDDHELNTKNRVQALVKQLEVRANESQHFQPLSMKWRGFFSVCVLPVAVKVISIITPQLNTFNLILCGIGLIETLFFGLVVISAISRIFELMLNKHMRQCHEMAQDIKLYCILRDTSHGSQT